MVPDAHVDPKAEDSNKIHRLVKDTIKNKKLPYLVCRGIFLENTGPNGESFAKTELLCENEQGVINILKLLEALKGKVIFTYVRIMGDNHINNSV